jgi:hypothetical protein
MPMLSTAMPMLSNADFLLFIEDTVFPSTDVAEWPTLAQAIELMDERGAAADKACSDEWDALARAIDTHDAVVGDDNDANDDSPAPLGWWGLSGLLPSAAYEVRVPWGAEAPVRFTPVFGW